jgi:hypothetical protein
LRPIGKVRCYRALPAGRQESPIPWFHPSGKSDVIGYMPTGS